MLMVLPDAKLVRVTPMHVLGRRRSPMMGGKLQQATNGEYESFKYYDLQKARLTFIPKVQAVRTNFSPAVVTSASVVVHVALVLGVERERLKRPREK